MSRKSQPTTTDILTYYNAVLRHEEALQSRLKVYAGGRSSQPHTINLLEPGFGSHYAKIPVGADWGGDVVVDLLTRKAGSFDFPFVGDFPALFEHWLRSSYQKERRVAMGGTGEDAESTYVVGFPTVFFPGRSEIDLVLRFPLGALEFRDETRKAWTAPLYRERKQGFQRPLPTSVVLFGDAWDPSDPPYSVHTQLLSRTFGLPEEDITEVFGDDQTDTVTSPRDVIRKLIGLLRNPDAPQSAIPHEKDLVFLLNTLCTELQNRITGGARIFRVPVVYDGNQSAATRGLQAELRTLRERKEDLSVSTPFSAVLLGSPFHQGRQTLRGQHQETPLTAEQVEALEIFRDTELVSVQGPPGTGKTTLVMSALADALVEWAKSLKSNGSVPPTRLTVVASTNNRAVDNAIQPLSLQLPHHRLPLALRTGSQEVTQTVTQSTLIRVQTWLKQSQEDSLDTERLFKEKRRLFNDAYQAQQSPDDPVERAYVLRTELEWLTVRNAHITQALVQHDANPPTGTLAELEPHWEHLQVTIKATKAADDRFIQLMDRIDDGRLRQTKSLIKAARSWVNAYFLPVYKVGMATLGEAAKDLVDSRFDVEEVTDVGTLKPQVLDFLLHCEFIVDETLERLKDRATDLEVKVQYHRRIVGYRNEFTQLQLQKTQLQQSMDDLGDPELLYREGAKRRYALFVLALDVREAWVKLHRREIETVLQRAIDLIQQRRTVKALLEKDDNTTLSLGHLFPVLGCTLLSFSNVFALKKDAISQLIVDEAGQCHPAYVLPALARSRRAMIIGDVHQLEPVVQLDEEEEGRALRRAKFPPKLDLLEPFRALTQKPTSAQALANRVCDRVISLKEHYRCQQEIIDISDALCNYGLRVRTVKRSYVDQTPELLTPVILAPVFGDQERTAGSWRNVAEVERVAQIVAGLIYRGIPHNEIAVLTPYRGQLLALKRKLAHLFGAPEGRGDELDMDSFLERGIALGTVHRFQGGERDIVIFSTTLSQTRSLPFLNDRVNLVNVAVSRARAHLVVVGHPPTLSQGRVTKELVQRATSHWPEPKEGLGFGFGG